MVEGRAPALRGSASTASRRARATDLNVASAIWWLLIPCSASTCSVMPPFVASAWKNSRTSSVSKLPIFAVGMSDYDRGAGFVYLRDAAKLMSLRDGVTGLRLKNVKTDEATEIDVAGVFIAIS